MERIATSFWASGIRTFRPLDRFAEMMALGRSRRRLGDLDEHMLRDIGLTSAEARRKAERPIWNAPDHWLR